VYSELEEIVGKGSVAFDEPMSRHTTLKIGGPADVWLTPKSVDTLRKAVAWLARKQIPITPIGGGSNLLVKDGGIRGAALSTKHLREIERLGDTAIRCQAGVSTGKLLSMATRWDLGGVEFLGGVPGSVGGGWIMNAGTYLGEFKDVTREVTSVSLTDGALKVRDLAACGFVYRGSAFPKTEVVVEGIVDLKPRPKSEIQADVRALRERRKDREPKLVSNAGSVFKNPPNDYAGRLLEVAGMKGVQIGDALCSPVHANWFVNVKNATARDMLELIQIGRDKVKTVHGIDLVLEWKIIGEDARTT
jgi:UDP-N-acetylmuramate dehydrogenase